MVEVSGVVVEGLGGDLGRVEEGPAWWWRRWETFLEEWETMVEVSGVVVEGLGGLDGRRQPVQG